ncbi:hypothetical protein C8R45DRAFT_248837 [Mycena sanguinolenta]|nr:hypothetical protein C8R45DRAFT_248837 [Mycena sanguinolenta]
MGSAAVILVLKRIQETSGFMDEYSASEADLDGATSMDDDESEADLSMDEAWSHRSKTHSGNYLRPAQSLPQSFPTQEHPHNPQRPPVTPSVPLSSLGSRTSQIHHQHFALPVAYLQAYSPSLVHLAPNHHRFAPISSSLSEYVNYFPRRHRNDAVQVHCIYQALAPRLWLCTDNRRRALPSGLGAHLSKRNSQSHPFAPEGTTSAQKNQLVIPAAPGD